MFGAVVQLGEIGRDAVEFDLGQERLLELTKRPLDFAFAFGITGCTRRDRRRMMRSEPNRRRMQHEPPALRPAVVVLLAMMAADGTSVLRNVYVINRGYEDLAERLNSIGAQIEIFRDI